MECCRDVFILHYSKDSFTYPMTVSLVQWRALIGFLICQISGTSKKYYIQSQESFVSMLQNLLLFYHCLEGVYITIVTFLYIFAP